MTFVCVGFLTLLPSSFEDLKTSDQAEDVDYITKLQL